MIIIQIIQKTTIFSHVDICFSSPENNNLYAHIIHITIHTAMAIEITISSISLNIKFIRVTHHHCKSLSWGCCVTHTGWHMVVDGLRPRETSETI